MIKYKKKSPQQNFFLQKKEDEKADIHQQTQYPKDD